MRVLRWVPPGIPTVAAILGILNSGWRMPQWASVLLLLLLIHALRLVWRTARRRGSRLVAKDSQRLAAPPSLVFAVLMHDDYLVRIDPSVVEHRDVIPLPNGGHSCTTVRRHGKHLHTSHAETTEVVPGRSITTRTESDGGRSQTVVTLEEVEGSTALTVVVEGLTPRPLGMIRWLAVSGAFVNATRQRTLRLAEVVAQVHSSGGHVEPAWSGFDQQKADGAYLVAEAPPRQWGRGLTPSVLAVVVCALVVVGIAALLAR